ncbi:hypothetical protein PRUPE_3G069200 [Prunus persica]|uniref:OVATE domain-containing protein n=1 Tax=Prunus persica TaxID=3760 RepID=M5WVU9_PRUPE|nr:uncharacterized protein LOC18782703 [Prunus persica]ONI15924.1 hypothetical protein PRUPE_3G069200 [Prunus persica]
MVLQETIHNSKNFFHKTLGNLKSFFFGGYKKLPKTLSFNPFYCGRDPKYHQTDQFYTDFYDDWESTLDKANKRDNASKEPTKEDDACSGSSLDFSKQSPKKSKQEGGLKQKKQMGSSHHLGKKEVQSSLQSMNGGSLAKKMKEFEMVDTSDVEQVLDVEEALHYYSRLKSPVYVDIVDKFFLDMYSDFSVPRASININNSKRRLGSQRLGSIRL